MIRFLLAAALLLAPPPPPTGDGYLVQVEQGTGRSWRGPLSDFKPEGSLRDGEPDAWSCTWREITPVGTKNGRRSVTVTLADARVLVEEHDPEATWSGTYRRTGRNVEAEGVGKKGSYRRHYCTFSLRIRLPEPVPAAGPSGTSPVELTTDAVKLE